MITDGLFNFLKLSKDSKKLLFYGICIWIRALIAFLFIYFGYHNREITSFVGIVLGSIAVFWLQYVILNSKRKVWWNRSVHFLFAIAFLTVSILSYKEKIPGWWMGVVFAVDLIYGFLNSLLIK